MWPISFGIISIFRTAVVIKIMRKMKILPAAYVLALNPIRNAGINLGLI